MSVNVLREDFSYIQNATDPLASVNDPRSVIFDITEEAYYFRKILAKLREMDVKYPSKQFVSIFYERYIRKYRTEVICKNHNLREHEYNLRIIEMVRQINNVD